MTRIAFHLDDFSLTHINACTYIFAKLCKIQGHMVAIIAPLNSSGELRGKFQEFPLECSNNLDEVCFRHRVKVFYRLCFSAQNIILPTVTPSCIHLLDSTASPAGDVCQTLATVGIPPNSLAYLAQEEPSFQDLERYYQAFDQHFIQPALKISCNYGIAYKRLIGIFIGSKELKEATVFHLPELSPPIALPQIHAPLSRKYKLKLLCNWTSQLYQEWGRMQPPHQRLTVLTDEAQTPDYYVIINKPPPGAHFEPTKTIVFRMEPYIEANSFYNDWYSSKGDFMYFLEHEHFRNNSEWWLSQGISELIQPLSQPKSKSLSTILSSQYSMEGHKLRVDFVKYFQAHSQLPLEVFGYDNTQGFSNYQGSLPKHAKDQGILPYKYFLAGENSSIPNYFTEKLIDGLLGEALTFYWGCPNLENFLDPRAFIRVDLTHPAEALALIERAIQEDEWAKRLPFIRQEKYRLVQHLNFFSRVQALLDIHNDIGFYQLSNLNLPIPGLSLVSLTPSTPDLLELQPKLKNFMYPKVDLAQMGRFQDHYRLWEQAANGHALKCLLETVPGPNFLDHLTTLCSQLNNLAADWDLVFLAWYPTDGTTLEQISRSGLVDLKSFLTQMATSIGKLDHGNLSYSYLLHPRGAAKLVETVKAHGIIGSLDEFFLIMLEIQPNFRSYLCEKNLTGSTLPELPKLGSFHVFRKDDKGVFSNTCPEFSLPPVINKELLLVPENALSGTINFLARSIDENR